MNTVYLLLGSNEGNRMQWLELCMQQLANSATITAKSPVYETAAWGIEEQPDFLNMAICLETHLAPGALLQAIQQTEKNLGRQREVKWGQRTLDIDILFYNDDIINLPDLQVPHPHLHERRFALMPLNAIAPQLVHPHFNKTIATLLEQCPDPLEVWLYAAK
jgi:2-amino-4-hydroxy-6-hydroxymethyldihydropteridine diphosphokinase